MDVEVDEDCTRRLLTRIIKVQRKIGDAIRLSVETHRLRTFDREEILELLSSAGFITRVTHAYGSVELAPHRMGFIAHKQRHD